MLAPEVRETAYAFLPWMIVLPFISVWSFQLDGIFIGATWTQEMRNCMAVSLALFAVAVPLALLIRSASAVRSVPGTLMLKAPLLHALRKGEQARCHT